MGEMASIEPDSSGQDTLEREVKEVGGVQKPRGWLMKI